MQLSPKLEFHSFNICNFLIGCSISIIAPFFPIFANFNGLEFTLIGVIFSMHPLGGFFGSLYLGSILTEKNRINMIIWSVLIQSGCMALFAVQYYLPFYYFIVITAFLARIINGIAYSALLCGFYSYIPKLFPDDFESHIALAETASSLGFMFGPFIESMLFSLGGYTTPFIVLSILSILCAGFIKFYISPKAIILPIEFELQDLQQLQDTLTEDQRQITYIETLQIYNFIIHIAVITSCTLLFTFPYPILAYYLLEQFFIDQSFVGFFMVLCPMAYMCASIIIIYWKHPPKQYMIFIGLLITSLSQFFLGPDKMFTGLDKSIVIFSVASIIQGGSAAFPFIFTLPQMTKSLIEKYPNRVDDCTNLSSAAFSASIFLGEFIGPLFSGMLHIYFQFDRIASIFGSLIILVCIAYIPLLRAKHQ